MDYPLDIIVIDYVEGAGGNTFARFINEHLGLEHNEYVLSYMAHNLFLYNKFDIVGFTELCSHHNINKIAIPFHLYSNHIFLSAFAVLKARFVKIDHSGYRKVIKHNFIDKALLKRMTDKEDVEGRINYLANDVQLDIMDLQENGKLLGVDLVMALANEPITDANRKQRIYNVLNTTKGKVTPSDDIVADYGDFFLNVNLPKYNELCNELGLTPDENLYTRFLVDNQRHYLDMLNFSEDSINKVLEAARIE